jgi:hypothetical protein
MDQTHVHLLLNHVAILGAIFSLVLLMAGAVFVQPVLKKAALIGMVFSALVAVPVFLTGEEAEESVEKLPGVTEAAIHEHEEAGEAAIWMIGVSGLAAAISLFLGVGAADRGRKFLVVVYILSILSSVAMARTGWLGGKIRHTELGTTAVGAASGEEHED